MESAGLPPTVVSSGPRTWQAAPQAQRSLQEGSTTCSTSSARALRTRRASRSSSSWSSRAQDEKGFTLIELLVVILIIGILAAIALPAFLSQRGKAQDTEAKTTARTAQTAFETQYLDANAYSGGAAELKLIEPALNDGPAFTAAGTGQAWTATVTSATGNTFTIAKDAAGNVTRKCAGTAKGGCPSAGWTKAP